jgi:DNA-binding LacI/PurR family transcriptional regulator
MQGVEEEAPERGYAVMLGRTGAKSVFIAGYLRTLRTYRAAGVILISAVIAAEPPDHVARPDPAAERVDAGREGGGRGLAAGLA